VKGSERHPVVAFQRQNRAGGDFETELLDAERYFFELRPAAALRGRCGCRLRALLTPDPDQVSRTAASRPRISSSIFQSPAIVVIVCVAIWELPLPDGMQDVFLLPGFEPTAEGSQQRILGSEFNHSSGNSNCAAPRSCL
jgi:hypothetical protein